MQDNPIELYKNLTELFDEKDDIMQEADKIISEINKKRELFRQCNIEINAINIKSISNSVVSYDAFRLHQKRKDLMEELSKLEEEALNLKNVKNNLDEEIEEIRSKLVSITPVMQEDDKPKSIYVEALDDNMIISMDSVDLIQVGAPLSKANEVVIDNIKEVYEENSVSINIPEEEIIKNRELSEFEAEVKTYTTGKNREIDDQLQMLQVVFENKEEEKENEEQQETTEETNVTQEEPTVSEPEEEKTEEAPVINIEQPEENKPVISLEDVQEEKPEVKLETVVEEKKPILESSPIEETPVTVIQETPQNIVSLSDLGLNTPVEPIKVDSLEELENINNINSNETNTTDNVIYVDFNKKLVLSKIAKATNKKLETNIIPRWNGTFPETKVMAINLSDDNVIANETPEPVEMNNNEESIQINTQDPGFSLESFTQGTEKKAA